MIKERESKSVGNGETRNVFVFWKKFGDSIIDDEKERIPYVRHDHLADARQSIGEILCGGSYFTMLLCRACFGFCFFGYFFLHLNTMKSIQTNLFADILRYWS